MLRHDPYIIQLIPLEFLVQIRLHEKEEDAFDFKSELKLKCHGKEKNIYIKRSSFSYMGKCNYYFHIELDPFFPNHPSPQPRKVTANLNLVCKNI